MENILVIGGAGFCGINLAKFYLSGGYNVRIFDRMSRKYGKLNVEWLINNENDLQVVKGDITHYDSLETHIVWADKIFHVAGQVASTTSIENPRQDFMSNVMGTFNVLESVRNNNPSAVLLYMSTNKVYGRLENFDIHEFPPGVDESFPINPTTPYGCSKCSAELYVRDYHRIYDLKTVVFRQSCIYGNRQFGLLNQGWISWIVYNLLSENPITIYGDGNQVRDILHVDDLVRVCDSVTSKETSYGSVYNIGGGLDKCLSLNGLIDFLSIKDAKIQYDDASSGDQKIYISDIRKAKKELDWTPIVSVEEGLGKFISWIDKYKYAF